MHKLKQIERLPFDDWTKSVPKGCLVNRDQVIVDACRGKSVLHVGACDAPFDLDKGRAGELLHQKVKKVAGRLVGVDVDRKAIESLKEIGIDDIVEADICLENSLDGEIFDVVLCCDVIEHVPSPGLLLAGCRRFMGPSSRLVVTTINGTALKPALRALRSRESVHSDHVAYFSYATLGKLLLMEGLKPLEFGAFSYPTVYRVTGWISRIIMSAAPAAADGIFFSAKLRS